MQTWPESCHTPRQRDTKSHVALLLPANSLTKALISTCMVPSRQCFSLHIAAARSTGMTIDPIFVLWENLKAAISPGGQAMWILSVSQTVGIEAEFNLLCLRYLCHMQSNLFLPCPSDFTALRHCKRLCLLRLPTIIMPIDSART